MLTGLVHLPASLAKHLRNTRFLRYRDLIPPPGYTLSIFLTSHDRFDLIRLNSVHDITLLTHDAHQPTATERTADAALVRRAEAVDD